MSPTVKIPQPCPCNFMHVSAPWIQTMKQFEGLRTTAYKDAVGLWTVGWGHQIKDPAPWEYTIAECQEFFEEDIRIVEACIKDSVSVVVSQGQFDALADWIFNLGCFQWRQSSAIDFLNQKFPERAINVMCEYVYAGHQILPGLVSRREAERIRWHQ